MSQVPGASPPLSILTLRTIRAYIRRSHAVMMTAFFAIVYALGSMFLGSMLLLTHLTPPYYAEIVWSGGAPSWNYPGFLLVEPWGVLTLPFFGTVAMVLVSIGVGIGMSVAVLLAIALVRGRRARAGRPAAVGSVAGLTPAMIALVTLGACCSTTAAATAGVGIVGQVSGTSTDNLLLNNWFLGVFQIAVVWIALLAQELILRVYGGLFGWSSAPNAPVEPPALNRRTIGSAALRVALLIGAITWSLAMFAQWTVISPYSASALQWFGWIVGHQGVALFVILAALFPRPTREALTAPMRRVGPTVVRSVLAVGGITMILMAVVPSTVALPTLSVGPGWLFSWIVQTGLVGGFAVSTALAPRVTLGPLAWSAPDLDPVGYPNPAGSGVAAGAGLEASARAHPGGPSERGSSRS